MDEKSSKGNKIQRNSFLMCIQLDYSITKQNFICVYFDISEEVNSIVIKLNRFVLLSVKEALSSLKFPLK